MKKIILALGIFLGTSYSFAQTINTDLIDQQSGSTLESLQNKMTYEKSSSCSAFGNKLKEFADILPDNQIMPYAIGGGVKRGTMELEALSNDAKATPVAAPSASNTVEFSETNLQKIGVDESEILKNDGEYLYYVNQKNSEVQIIRAGAQNQSDITIVSKIQLPKDRYNAQIYLYKNKLIVLGTRYYRANGMDKDFIQRSSRSVVAIFDRSNPSSIKLSEYYDVDGNLSNSRLVDGKLELITSVGINWYQLQQDKKDFSNLNNLPKAVIRQGTGFKEIETPCNQIDVILPSKETFEKMNMYPEFLVIGTINLEQKENFSMSVLLGNHGEIHMSKNSLYIAQTMRSQRGFPCPRGMFCIMPAFQEGGQFTLIHKFELSSKKYISSNIVKGRLLTQYSMDEDNNKNFRIVTQNDNRFDNNSEVSSNIYVLDTTLKLVGKIENLEKGEEFKASRFIGDTLYLVTFPQPKPFPRDPLFAIDLGTPASPKVLGELRIPGYSTYLHPIGEKQNGKQYLLGLGYNVVDQTGGTFTESGIKLDIYEVDFSQKETVTSKCGKISSVSGLYASCLESLNTGNIKVQQLFSSVFGGEQSRSEALENPRMFVFRNNNQLIIPMILAQTNPNGQSCSVQVDISGKEISRSCFPQITTKVDFFGTKVLSISTMNGISEEKSYNLLEEAKKNLSSTETENIWSLRSLQSRVAYIGNRIITVTNDFIHITDGSILNTIIK